MNPANTDRSAAVRRWWNVGRWCLVLVLGLSSPLPAQNGDPAESESLQGGLLYRRPDGNVVPLEDLLRDSRKIDQVVQWLTTQEYVPRYDTIITASGRVSQGQARIHVELQIEVHMEDEWVLVPVGFHSWTIQNFQHTPKQPGFESRFAGNASGQRQWYLSGKGSHTLSLDLIGDVRDQDADRQRLKLSVPDSVKSSLQLTFDQPVQNVRGNIGNQSRVTTSDDESTVTFYGLERETEITWEASGTAGDETTVITAPDAADMTLDLTSSTASLKCTQMINITDGAVEQLSVRLPAGYSYAAITGTDDAGNKVVKSDDVTINDGVATASVVFTKPVRRRVQLEFDLRRGDTEFPQTILVSVPEISGVAEQSGKVHIRIPRGLYVNIPVAPLTQRIRVEPQPDLLSEATAYELLSTEASLQVTVREQEARFTALPQLEFSTDDQSLLLLARFRINVSLGSLDELTVSWKDFDKDGWQVVPGSFFLRPDKGTGRELTHDIPNGSQLHLMLDNFQSGNFSVQFQAFRDLIAADDDTDSGSFHLPDVKDARDHETIVSLVESDMYSLSLTSAHDGRSFGLVPSSRLTTPDSPNRTTNWLVKESGSRVRVEESLQTQEISSSAVVGLDVERDNIQVHTIIDMNVLHSDLRELRFTAYDSAIPTLTLGEGTDALPKPELDGDKFVWQLPEPMRGQHRLSLRYLWTPPTGTDNVRLPLILPASGVDSLIIGTRIPDVISVIPEDAILPVHQDQFVEAWNSDDALTAVGLHIPQALSQHQPQLPSICLVETQIGPVNVTTTTTLFYDVVPESVEFSLPAGAGVYASVNGFRTEAQKTELVEMDAGEMRRVTIPRQFTQQPEDGVAVSLICQTPRGPHHHLLSREIPDYPHIVSPPDWLTTVWLVSTVQNHRLVSLDPDYQAISDLSLPQVWLSASGAQMPPAIETVVRGLPENVRFRFQQQYTQSAVSPSGPGSRSTLAFVSGPQLQAVPVLIYSRAMGWVVAAGLGILLYAGLVTFRQHLRLIVAVAVPTCVLIWGLLPQQVLSLLFPMLPAILAALIAWTLRQLLMPAAARRRTRQRRRSVFATTARPQPTSSVSDSAGVAASLSPAEPAVQ